MTSTEHPYDLLFDYRNQYNNQTNQKMYTLLSAPVLYSLLKNNLDAIENKHGKSPIHTSFKVSCIDNVLTFENLVGEVCVECKCDWRGVVKASVLQRLFKILQQVPDQPITIDLVSDGGGIEIRQLFL